LEAGVADLDHVRAPVAEHRARRRCEREQRELDHPNAVEDVVHALTLAASRHPGNALGSDAPPARVNMGGHDGTRDATVVYRPGRSGCVGGAGHDDTGCAITPNADIAGTADTHVWENA